MQFLTTSNGEIPEGFFVPENARLTRPTPRPAAPEGMCMLDLGDGQQIDGIWFQKWTAVAEPVLVPKAVTPIQARRALRAIGLENEVNSAIASASTDVKETWEYALEIQRNNDILNSMAASIGITMTQLDQIFILAETL